MNILYALRRAKQFHAQKIALYDGDSQVDYASFADRVARAANALRGLGLAAGDRVGVLMLNAPAYLELYHATALARLLIVPINIRWNLDDIVFSLADAGARLLVVDDYFARLYPALSAAIPGLAFLFAGKGACPAGMASYEASLAAASPIVPDQPDPDGDEVAGLFYTSGTTGGPKGVMLTHNNLCANAIYSMITFPITDEWVWLHAAPMFHLADASFVYSSVMNGVANCFLGAFDPEAFLRLIERHRVTHTVVVPTMLNAVMNHPAVDRYDTSSLRIILYGASPMPADLLRRAHARFQCRFAQGYGLSEASPVISYLAPEDHIFEGCDQPFARIQSAGRPVLGVEVRIVDAMDRDVPPGEIGEVVARGANIMKGYWNRPDITAETLRNGWLHTGDMGAFDADGYLHILDRKKDMIKPGGENVYSPEVEATIACHPEVLEVAVIGVPDPRWTEAVKAVVVKRAGATLTEAALIEFCRARMTHFKCPTSVDFVDSLPKGGTGKLQKNLLREQYRTSAAVAK
jgi:long-chain acyl-CoA synthetase